MFHLIRFASCLILAMSLVSCAGDSAPTNDRGSTANSDDAGAFDDVRTPPPAAASTADEASSASSRETARMPNQPETAAPSKGAVSDEASAKEADIAIVPATKEPDPPRESLAGRWEFLICNFGADIMGMLIEVEQQEDTYTAKVVSDSPMMPGWKIASADVTKKSAVIEFTSHDDSTVSFEGALQDDGVVRGNVMFGEEGLELVRWMPTDRESLEGAPPQVPSVNVEMMEGFQPDPDNALPELREKAKELGTSALAYELYRRLSAVYRGQRPDEDAYSGFPEAYLAAAKPWGERVTAKANLDIAYTMASCGYSASEALDHLSLAEQELGEVTSPSMQRRLTIVHGLIDLQSDDATTQQQGMESLQAVRTDDPYNSNDVTLGMAAYYERNSQPEEALALYSQLAALPTGAGDMAPVMKLWEELGRDPSELDHYLDEIYQQHVHEFAAPDSDAPRADGTQQVILGELFTGATCPPCVAADIATGGLEKTYPKSDLIMLRYHEHVPGADPLTVPAGEKRAGEYYRVQGTPSLYFNGQPIQVVSMYGGLENAPAGYADLRQIVDQLLTQSTDLNIDVTAKANDGAIDISAAVSGVDEIPDTWKLRVCLADDEVAFPAANGVRLHEMVVRAMPGGAAGVGVEDGQLKFTGTVSLADLRQEITEYISQYRGLSSPPMEMSHLHVVAFVQDDANQRVLQAAAASVTGLDDAAESITELGDTESDDNAVSPATADDQEPSAEN